MKSSLVTLAVEHSEEARALPVEPYVYGILAFVVLMALLVITLAFRSVWTRHR